MYAGADVEGRKPVDGVVRVGDAEVRVGRRGQRVSVGAVGTMKRREEHLVGGVGVLLTCSG